MFKTWSHKDLTKFFKEFRDKEDGFRKIPYNTLPSFEKIEKEFPGFYFDTNEELLRIEIGHVKIKNKPVVDKHGFGWMLEIAVNIKGKFIYHRRQKLLERLK